MVPSPFAAAAFASWTCASPTKHRTTSMVMNSTEDLLNFLSPDTTAQPAEGPDGFSGGSGGEGGGGGGGGG